MRYTESGFCFFLTHNRIQGRFGGVLADKLWVEVDHDDSSVHFLLKKNFVKKIMKFF